MRIRATTALTAAALLALTACTSSDEDGGTAKPTPAAGSSAPGAAATALSEPPVDDGSATLKTVVAAYTDTYFAGDSMTAWEMLSARCQDKITPEVYRAAVEKAAADYGPDHAVTDVKAEVSGATARVSYKVEGLPKFDRTGQPWARSAGVWQYDAC